MDDCSNHFDWCGRYSSFRLIVFKSDLKDKLPFLLRTINSVSSYRFKFNNIFPKKIKSRYFEYSKMENDPCINFWMFSVPNEQSCF